MIEVMVSTVCGHPLFNTSAPDSVTNTLSSILMPTPWNLEEEEKEEEEEDEEEKEKEEG